MQILQSSVVLLKEILTINSYLMKLREELNPVRQKLCGIQLFMLNSVQSEADQVLISFISKPLLKMSKYLCGEDLTDMLRIQETSLSRWSGDWRWWYWCDGEVCGRRGLEAVNQKWKTLSRFCLWVHKLSSSLSQSWLSPEVNRDSAELTLSWRSKSLSELTSPDLTRKEEEGNLQICHWSFIHN